MLDLYDQIDEAKRRYEHILEIDPDAVVAANNLAWLHVQRDQNLDFERRILRHAYLSDPKGRILCRNGASARVLEGFMLRYLRDQNPLWKDLVQQTLQGWIDTFYCPPGPITATGGMREHLLAPGFGARTRGRMNSC